MTETFAAMMLEETEGKARARPRKLTLEELPDRDVLVEVAFSSLNYKDGLALSGNRNRVARTLPVVPGIDLAGTVVESRSPLWRTGDQVIANGWGLGETAWGGYTRFQRVDAGWLLPLPDAFTFEQAMAIGTAGYTAALCVNELERWGVLADDGREVLVTGAAGGVGSVGIALLAAAGHTVTASSGREQTHPYLRRLGATAIIDRSELAEAGRPLQRERWAAGIDCVGSTTLANLLAQIRYGGAVAACGLAAGSDFPSTVLPHILRGVALLGVDSVMAPRAKRVDAWARLARDLDLELLASMTTTIPMSALPEHAAYILDGQTQGRVVVDVTC